MTAGSGTVIAADDIGSGVLAQRVKPVWGPDGTGNDVDLATGLPAQAGYKEVSGSAAALNADLVSTDAAGYRWVMCQITGTWSGTVTFQASMDGTNWFNILVNRPDSTQNAFGTATGNNIYSAALPGRYFRARMTSYTSGTANAITGFSLHPAPVAAASARVDTFNAFSTSDASGLNYSFTINGINYVYNGSNFDRWRSFGTLGAGGVTPTPGTTGGWSVSSQTALSSTKTQVKASAGTVGGYIINNPNASTVWVQVFDVASGSITVGSTSPTWTIPVPAGSTANLEMTCGVNHATAINIAATTTATGSGAPSPSALTCTMFYK